MLKLQYFGHLMQRTNSLGKALMLGKIEGKRPRGMVENEMVSINDSMDMNPANSGRKWRTEEPGRLHSMGLQRVGHDCCNSTTTNSEILLSHFGVAYTGLLCMCAQSDMSHSL